MTDELRAVIRAAKPELLAIVGTGAAITACDAAPRPFALSKADGDAAHRVPWDDADCARFVERLAVLMRRGFTATDGDDIAERLHLRDAEGDDRRACVECANLDPRRRCKAVAPGLIPGAGPDYRPEVAVLRRCPEFNPHDRKEPT